MLNFEILENGNLSITAENPVEIQELLDDGKGYQDIIHELFEATSCNGSFTFFEGGYGNPYTGINNFPSVAESMDTDDDGNNEIVGRYWYLNDYCTVLETEEWAKGNTVIYNLYADTTAA